MSINIYKDQIAGQGIKKKAVAESINPFCPRCGISIYQKNKGKIHI